MILKTLKDTFFENISNSSESFSKHLHDTYAISITNRGMFKSIRKGAVEFSYRYSVRVINPCEVHEGVSKEWSFTTFYPKIELMSALYEEIFFKKKIPLFKNQIYNDKVLYDKLFSFFGSVFFKEESLSVETKAIDALSYLIKRYAEGIDDVPIKRDKRAIDVSLRYIDENITQNITLDRLSEISSLSKYHFLRVFKLHLGITPHQYIISQRVNLAKSHLRNLSDISAAALQSGFFDQSHFTRNFKKIYGYTPKKLFLDSNFIQY